MNDVSVPPAGTRAVSVAVEVHSIDQIPEDERHGRVWQQGPFWFMGNFVLVTLVTGFIGPGAGLGFWWSFAAIVGGVAFGTFFMAFHAVQGPRLGLPQMIQSRAQFGFTGAILPMLAVVFVYVGFNVFDIILAADGLDTLVSASKWVWYPLITVLAVAIAIIGHDLLHVVQRWLTYVSVAVFIIFTVGALLTLQPASGGAPTTFSATALVLQFGVAASYQISYAPYVSDYSRYLPRSTPAAKVIFWVYLGAAAAAVWLMGLGAFIASRLPKADGITAVQTVGNGIFDGFGTFVVLVTVPALISVMAVNSYGAMLTGATIADSLRGVAPTVRLRVAGVVVVGALSFIVALLIPTDYLGSFNNFLLLMLYFLVPWTAVNLVDFYIVRRGHYVVSEMFNPSGLYGRIGWRGVGSYLIGLASMAPFASTTIFTGPVAKALDGADVSFAVGLAVAGILYWLLARDIDGRREQQAASSDGRNVEAHG